METNLFFIDRDKEAVDSQELFNKIKQDNWVDGNTVIVNCSPLYSSRLAMTMNHKLCHLNKAEPFMQLTLQIPTGNMSQVYDENIQEYIQFDTYLKDWINKFVVKGYKYLFVASGIPKGRALNKLKLSLRIVIEPDDYRFASLYIHENCYIRPDYLVQEYKGQILFWWENDDSEKWDC